MYYRYARATRTLRAVAALLALHADELVDPCIKPPEALSFLPNPHTGLAFLFDVLAVVFVLAEEPVSARAKLSFRFSAASSAFGVCFCLRAVRHRSARGVDEGWGPEATA